MSYMSFVAGEELSGGIKYAVGKCTAGEMSDTRYKCLYRSLFSSVATVVLF